MTGPPLRRPWLRLLAGVALAGGIGWVVDTALLWLLATRAGVPAAVAAAIGFTASGVCNLAVNSRVFGGRGAPTRAQTFRFVTLFAVNLAVVSVLVPVLADALESQLASEGVRLIVAKLLATAALLPVNALTYHRWVFVPPTVAGRDTAR